MKNSDKATDPVFLKGIMHLAVAFRSDRKRQERQRTGTRFKVSLETSI